MMTLTIEIPALDRLCEILEDRNRWNTAEQLIAEIVKQLEAAAKDGTLEKAAKRPTTADAVPLPAEAGRQEKAAKRPTTAEAGRQEKTEKSPTTADAVPLPAEAGRQEKAPAPKEESSGATVVTLADVQKAAAQMRDDGKLEAVKALFPEFGIRKLSDLKGDALQGFAARLRGMGARI